MRIDEIKINYTGRKDKRKLRLMKRRFIKNLKTNHNMKSKHIDKRLWSRIPCTTMG